MKKILFPFLFAACLGFSASAQDSVAVATESAATPVAPAAPTTTVTVPEPEFEQEAILLTSDNTGIPLEIEHAKMKATSNIGLGLIGISKSSQYYQIDGATSPVTLDASAYDHDMRIIISWQDNKRTPKRLIQIIPLEIQKNRRIYNVAKYNDFKGASEMDQGYVNFNAQKYGDHSYLITIPASELKQLRDKNKGEFKKWGKQFVIRLLNASTNQLSDTEDFLTFGIKPADLY